MSRERPRSTWLVELLEQAIERNMCMSVHCTTCGAMEFRKKLLSHARIHADKSGTEANGLITASNVELARQLKLLAPIDEQARHWIEPVRLILQDLEGGLLFGGIPEDDLAKQLAGTWSGSVLEDMREHARALQEKQAERRRQNSPEAIEVRRAEKRRQKQAAHQARLAEKSVSDQRWFKKHPDALARCLEVRQQRAVKRQGNPLSSQQNNPSENADTSKPC